MNPPAWRLKQWPLLPSSTGFCVRTPSFYIHLIHLIHADEIVMFLDIFLLSLAIVQANRGNAGIWTSCVTDADYSAPAATSATTEAKIGYGGPTSVPVTPVTQYTQPYPQPVPSPQQAYPPQQVYTPPPQQPGMPMSGQV